MILFKYKKLLKFLINTYSPKKTIERYHHFLKQSGIVEGSPLFTKKVQADIAHNENIIKQSYEDAKKLVKILTVIVTQIKNEKKLHYCFVKNFLHSSV